MCKYDTILRNIFNVCKLHNDFLYISQMNDENTPNKYDFYFDNLIPGQSIDCVIIGFENEELQVLVLKWKGTDNWSLPGGFMQIDEDMDTAAVHILMSRTGLSDIFLEQFYTFGNKDRRNEIELMKGLKIMNMNTSLAQWFEQRFISTGYLSLVNIKNCDPKPDLLSEVCEWKPVSNLPELIFDHEIIVKKALEHIKIQINYLPVLLSLLPEKFTMKTLQKLIESILQRELDRGNFQKKVLKLQILERHEKQMQGGAHKAPYLYSFNRKKYLDYLNLDIGFVHR